MTLTDLAPYVPSWTPLFATTWFLYGTALASEKYLAHRRGRYDYDNRETVTNTFLLLVFALTTSIWGTAVLIPVFNSLREMSPISIFGGSEGTFSGVTIRNYIILIFLDDLCYYVYHRMMHASRLGWAFHDPHHSCSRFNMTVAAREPWVAIFFSGIFWAPLALLGFDGPLILFQQWVNFTVQLLLHFDGCPRLGWLEWIFSTPTHHKVHHGLNPQYRDKNFGGLFILWDRLMGTFVPLKEEPQYGTESPPTPYSPLAISLNGFVLAFRKSDPLVREPLGEFQNNLNVENRRG